MRSILDETISTPPPSPTVATPISNGVHGTVAGVTRIGAKAGLIAGGGLAAIVAAIFYGIGATGSHPAAPANPVPQAINTTVPSLDQIPGANSTAMPVRRVQARPAATTPPIVLPAAPPAATQAAPLPAAPAPAVQAQNALTTVPAIAPIPAAAVAAAAAAPIRTPSAAEIARAQAAQQRLAEQQRAQQVAQSARAAAILVPIAAPPAVAAAPAASAAPTAPPTPSPYALMTGSIIPATLVSGINSDLPGTILAQVNQPVYDSKSGQHLLIPAGTKLVGKFDANVVAGQSRVLVGWNRLIFPDGSSVDLGDVTGADAAGYAGVTGNVDSHAPHTSFLKTALTTLLTIGAAVVNPTRIITVPAAAGTVVMTQQNGTQAALQGAGQAAQALTQGQPQNAQPRPTISVPPGTTFTVIVGHDLAFAAPYGAAR